MQHIEYTFIYIFDEIVAFTRPMVIHPFISVIIFISILVFFQATGYCRFYCRNKALVDYNRSEIATTAAGVAGAVFTACVATAIFDIGIEAVSRMLHIGSTIVTAEL